MIEIKPDMLIFSYSQKLCLCVWGCECVCVC